MSDDVNTLRRRRRGTISTRLLVLLVAANALVLVAWAFDHTSRSDARFCSNCHNMTAHVDSYLHGNHLDAAHRRAQVGCKDCHFEYTMVDEARSVVAYVLGDYEEVFHRRVFDQSMCTGCHVSLEYQAGRTSHLARNPHRGHYPDLRCGACHLSHGRQVDFCGRCHDNGGQRMTEERPASGVRPPWERYSMLGVAASVTASETEGGIDG